MRIAFTLCPMYMHFHSFVYIRRAANINIKLDADEILTDSITWAQGKVHLSRYSLAHAAVRYPGRLVT